MPDHGYAVLLLLLAFDVLSSYSLFADPFRFQDERGFQANVKARRRPIDRLGFEGWSGLDRMKQESDIAADVTCGPRQPGLLRRGALPGCVLTRSRNTLVTSGRNLEHWPSELVGLLASSLSCGLLNYG
ncbi:unnamed protein product [Calypogeia fissa]